MSKCYYIPREINQQYVMIWKRDEAVCMFAPFGLCFLLPFPYGLIVSLALVIVAARLIKKLGADKPPGYLNHWLRYHLPKEYVASLFSSSVNLTRKKSLIFSNEALPSSYVRYIAG